jgi:hypothetical protein
MTAATSFTGLSGIERYSALMAIRLHKRAPESLDIMTTRALRQFASPSEASSDMTLDPEQCSCGHVEGRPSQAYNEEAFRYFLDIERKRSELSSQPFLLLLIEVKSQGGIGSDMDDVTAAHLFGDLAGCLRDTDFIGWYSEGRVIGAVLTQRPDMLQTDVSRPVAERVRGALNTHFDAEGGDRLLVRVFQVPPMPEREVLGREGLS